MKTICISPRVYMGSVEETLYIMDSGSQAIIRLNPAGAFIWNELQNGKSEEGITQELCERFPGVSQGKIKQDVHSFIAELVSREFIFEGDDANDAKR